MDLSIRDLNTYLNLISTGEAQPLKIPGCEGSDRESLLIPRLDNDEAILFDITSDSKVFLSDSTKKKIRETVDRHTGV